MYEGAYTYMHTHNETCTDNDSHQEIGDEGGDHHHAALNDGDGEKKVDESVHEVGEARVILHHQVCNTH